MTALSGEKTLAELSAEFGVHPTMISNWKQELVTRAGELFARGNKAAAVEDAQRVIDESAPQYRPAAGRARFSCRAARHLPIAERRAMIAPEAGLSISRQCTLLGLARSSFYYDAADARGVADETRRRARSVPHGLAPGGHRGRRR